MKALERSENFRLIKKVIGQDGEDEEHLWNEKEVTRRISGNLLVETISIGKVERCSHQKGGQHVSHIGCGNDRHELCWISHVLFGLENLRIALKQEHAKADEACKLAESFKVLWLDVQYSIDVIGKLRSRLQMKSYRNGSINNEKSNYHRNKSQDSYQLEASNLSLENNGYRHYVVSYSDEMIVLSTCLFSDSLTHYLLTFGAEIDVKTDQNIDEDDYSDGLLESQN